MADIINLLSALNPDSELATTRAQRPDALANAQRSFEALLEPVNPGTFSFGERYAIATYVAGVHQVGNATSFYSELMLDDAPATLRDAILAAVERGLSAGPYGSYREAGLATESEPGGVIHHDVAALGDRLAAALDVAHLMIFHPRDSRPEVLGRLSAAGWSADDTVSLTQLVSFLCFQLRVIHGLQTINGHGRVADSDRTEGTAADWELSDRGFEVSTYPELVGPSEFVAHPLGWVPWVPPVAKADLTAEQLDSLIKPERADMPYFRLLARDPQALKARTLTDLDIFYNVEGGIGRAERELAAAVASRLNGCVYCASVHAGRANEEAGRNADIDRLLAEGVSADLGDELWNAVAAAASALTYSPMRFDESHVERLRALDLDEASIIDVINAAAFFNWANRLMLVLGEPELPKRFR
ncbi:alkylhydroperoxidase domain protein [Corynebacterium sp. A21]|uniref:alkylhydroperoxidase domain protein n=1 Tax=Corynebacterium sp. A21 TaxID=3457318 RepID=UPI003FCF6457